jgi:hypothetical protein
MIGRTCGPPCRKTDLCKEAGQCTDANGSCEAGSDADCRRSDLCKSAGACAFSAGFCTPASEQDCKSSTACKTEGACIYKKGYCLRPRDLKCDCAPPGYPSPAGLKNHADCLAKGGGWGPLCGPAPP